MRAIGRVLKQPFYAWIAAGVALLFVCVTLILPVRSIVALSFRLPVDSLSERIRLVLGGLRAIPLNISESGIVFSVIIALLTGINVALLVYVFRTRATLLRDSHLSLFGMLSGIMGIGCASCGSVLLSSIIGLSASWTVIGILPLRGAEFSILAIALLAYSIHMLSRKLSPERIMACNV